MSSDPTLDPKIKRKLTSVLASWYRQFKSDPKMTLVANLYKTTKDENGQTLWAGSDAVKAHGAREREKEVARERERVEQREREVREKEEAKRRAKEVKAAEKAAKEAEAQKARQPVRPRKRFDYVKEKPVVLQSIVEASQAASNLVNALKLVHRPEEKVQDDARTQECLNQAKQVRKQIIRYIQLVEDEEVIGTLIESNERIIAALETYDQYCTEPVPEEESVPDNASVSVSSLSLHESEVQKLQAKQRGRVAESIRRGKGGSVHPDLQDLNFGELGASSSALPAPLRPTGPESPQASFRGSLSDFSDYNSSDEETHDRRSESPYASGHYSGHQGGGGGGGGGGGRPYGRYEESTSEVDVRGNARQGLLDEDPFADPFADQQEVTTPGITERKPLGW
ncbi:hypothetical protein SISSUDRAFT_1043021 [Sistotremastrum suecicum HHB10207 ss-3]|uniref:VHS domain-containing protein n=1 Tax=Sistotremastrum suecicum HHB10207 ss-3 TaxID=1314776 RepID=A0A166G8P3_9AGAM|nr:hypothetical protein SISSUDRAFT_1043021 [Sistotremastrum suecicum HHB10207 ss-3]